MRKVVRAFVGTALSLCLVGAVALAAAPTDKGPIRVGDFAVQLVQAMNLKVDGPLTEVSANKALGEIGIALGRLDRPLTEGELVGVLGQLGIRVRTSDPGREVTSSKASAVVRTFQTELSKASADSSIEYYDDFNNGNGKGGRYKFKGNPSPPGQTDD